MSLSDPFSCWGTTRMKVETNVQVQDIVKDLFSINFKMLGINSVLFFRRKIRSNFS